MEDWVNELIVPGLGIGASYNDAAGELTLSAATAPGNDYFFISLTSLSVTPSDGTINLTSADYAETTNTIVSFHLFHDFTTHVVGQELGMRVNGGTRRAIYRYANDVLYNLTAGDVIADGLYRFWRRDDDTWIVIAALPQIPDSSPNVTAPDSYLTGRGQFEDLETTFEAFGLKANSSAKVPTSKLPFTFNPATTPTHQLRTLTYGSDTYQVRSTFAVSTLSDRPAASASTVGHIYHILQNDTAYVGTNDKHVASAPEGDFAAIPARSDLHIVAHLPSGSTLNNATLGDFYFHNGGSVVHGGYEFYEVETHGAAKVLTNVHPDDALAASRSNNSWSVEWLGV